MTAHYEDGLVTLHHGDCLEVLRALPDDSVDSVVTDPPYNLSDSGKRDGDCLRRIIAEGALPQLYDRDPERGQRRSLSVPSLGRPALRREDGAVPIDGGVGVPESALNFQSATVGQQEVDAADVAPARPADGDLSPVVDPQAVEHLGDFVLQAANGGDAAFCDATCRCFTEPSAGVLAVLVALPGPSSGDATGDLFGARRGGHADVGLDDLTGGQPEGPAGVVAGAGAVRRAVLRLDLAGRTGELLPASSAGDVDPLFLLLPTEGVGADTRASGLTAMTQPARVRVVGDTADGTFALHMPWHKLKSSRTTGGFMGKRWDGWESPASFERWCLAWAAEALRVLKPGGHLLAFGGTRTWHRLAVAVEDAGFEVRDSIAWVYGSGFPKSLDVSKAIDKLDAADERLSRAREFQAWLRQHVTPQQVNAATGTDMGHHLTTHPTQPAIATADLFDRLRPLLPEVPERIEDLVRQRTVESENFKAREVVGSKTLPDSSKVRLGFVGESYNGDAAGATRDVPLTNAHTDAARQWQGWGTALKPAFEPVVVARKPLVGTVAATVLQYGTGALNIDGCRVEGEAGRPYPPNSVGVFMFDGFTSLADLEAAAQAGQRTPRGQDAAATLRRYRERVEGAAARGNTSDAGRWPANVVLDGDAADELDRQSGVLRSPGSYDYTTPDTGHERIYGGGRGVPKLARREGFADSGGASRFFPTFRYQAKAPTRERPRGDDGTAHPTVKPLALMRWLVRLVTPPGGVVLEPFAGSGTTVEAALLEGFRCIAIEREPSYLPLIEQRIRRVTVAPPEPPPTAPKDAAGYEQPDLFGGAA